MGKTKIEWCDESVNFITGCRHGCEYCYARGTAARNARMGSARYVAVEKATEDPFHPTYHDHIMLKEFERLLRAQRSRIVFIGSMSDPAQKGTWLFMDSDETSVYPPPRHATSDWVQYTIAHFCEKLPNHRFILLTKKPSNLRRSWPDNVWIGTSVANNRDASFRIPTLLTLLQTSVSDEDKPLSCGGLLISAEPLQGDIEPGWLDTQTVLPGWLVIGSQTRPALHPGQVSRVIDNARELVDWASSRGVPCFIKDNLARLSPGDNWPREFPAAFGR